jgi:dihydrodiol dehydrogenase / D-xylose 1-dehydrogenase (NADP)
MVGLGSQVWGPVKKHHFPLPPLEGPFNFVNSQGLWYEALEVVRCLKEGKTESAVFDSAACADVMATLTSIRSTWMAP